jgi:hypothetical protein
MSLAIDKPTQILTIQYVRGIAAIGRMSASLSGVPGWTLSLQ